MQFTVKKTHGVAQVWLWRPTTPHGRNVQRASAPLFRQTDQMRAAQPHRAP